MKYIAITFGLILLGSSCQKSSNSSSSGELSSKEGRHTQSNSRDTETSQKERRKTASFESPKSIDDAKKQLEQCDKNDVRSYARIEALIEWIAKSDCSAAMDEIALCPPALQFLLSQASLMKFVTTLSVDELVQKFSRSPSNKALLITNFKMVTLLKIANQDATKALQLLSKMDDGDNPLILDPTINALAVLHGENCLPWIAEGLPHGMQASAVTIAIQAIARTNPREGMALVAAHLKGSQAAECYQSICQSYLTKNPQQIKEYLDNLPKAFLPQVLMKQDLIGRILTTDSDLAHTMLEHVPLTSSNSPIIANIITSLAKLDQSKALTLLQTLPPSSQKEQLTRNLFETLARSDAESAVKSVATIPKEEQSQAMRAIAKVLTTTDFQKALDLAGQVSTPMQQDVYREIARASAFQSPQQAVAMINDKSLSEKLGTDFRSEMINHTVQNWAKQNLEEAQQWVEKLPATDQPKGVQGLVASWMKSDPIAASEWLSKQAAGPARDAGAQEIINQVKDTDPEMAEQWRKSMTPK